MSEEKHGEFTKRIERLRDLVNTLRDEYGVTHNPVIKYVAEEIIATIKTFDEAKKDFPEILYPNDYAHNYGNIPWCNPERAAGWFIKWLGMQKK